jgi:two-component system response regulator MtrA
MEPERPERPAQPRAAAQAAAPAERDAEPGRAAREARRTILLVEDDPGVALTLVELFEAEGYDVAHATSGAQAKAMVDTVTPALVMLDLVLPDADGLVLCAELKARIASPIIICSATNRKRDAVLGFKLGADDFIAKPFQLDELLTRVQAALHRAARAPREPAEAPVVTTTAGGAAAAPAVATSVAASGATAEPDGRFRSFQVGDLSIDHARRNVKLGDVSVSLTPTEYRLIAALASRPEEVLSRQDLAQIVWGYQDASIGRSIDVHLHRLRAKLRDASVHGEHVSGHTTPPQVVSVRGFGYKITCEPPELVASAA